MSHCEMGKICLLVQKFYLICVNLCQLHKYLPVFLKYVYICAIVLVHNLIFNAQLEKFYALGFPLNYKFGPLWVWEANTREKSTFDRDIVFVSSEQPPSPHNPLPTLNTYFKSNFCTAPATLGVENFKLSSTQGWTSLYKNLSWSQSFLAPIILPELELELLGSNVCYKSQ